MFNPRHRVRRRPALRFSPVPQIGRWLDPRLDFLDDVLDPHVIPRDVAPADEHLMRGLE